MTHAILVFVFFAASLVCRGDDPAVKDGWSETVDGLRARLIFGKGTTCAGSRLPEVYLELYNASRVANPIEFDFNACRSLHFYLHTAEGNPVPAAKSVIRSGGGCTSFQISLPYGGTLKFPVTADGYGVRPNFGTMLFFENEIWELPYGDRAAYFLSATVEVPEAIRDPSKVSRWHGTLKLPPIKAPTFK